MPKKQLKVLRIAITLLLAVFLLASCAREAKQEAATKVNWLRSYDEALAAAKKDNQPIMIDFYADWCKWCRELDGDTYVNKDVVALAQKFVSLKVDADVEGELSSRYKVVGLPTILFINPDGKEIHRVVGYRPPGQFVGEMNTALKAFKG
jgi:thioredoxin 1